jgi:hypothetical protein
VSKVKALSWTFGVTSATSSLKAVGTTYLQIHITTVNNDGDEESRVIETDVNGLYGLISEVERVRSVMGIAEGEDV